MIAVFAATSSNAQQLPVQDAEVEAVDRADPGIVVSASRATREAREIGSAVSVIGREDLQENQITFVNQILQDIPGVLTTTDRPGDFAQVSIRGSNNDEVLWLIDGIELGDPSSTSTAYNADHLIASDIARIEVLRGNQSSLYGSDAIGGVINVITQRATQEGVTVSAEAEVGSYYTTQGGASILGKSGPIDFRVTATGYRHNGPSLADPATATGPADEDDEYWRYGFSGRLGAQASENLSFQTIGFWLDSFTDLDNTTSDNFNIVRKREYGVAGQGTFNSSDEAFQAQLTLSRYNARRLFFGEFNRAEGDLYDGTKENIALDLTYDAADIVSFATGANFEWESTDQVTNFSGDFNEGINTRSGYGEIALRPVEGLTFTGAARIDDNSRFGSFDTYRVTAAYAVGLAKLRGSYGTGAKAPGLYQLFDPLYGNLDLQVEESDGWDVGVDVALGRIASAEISYFTLKKTNEIIFDVNRGDQGGYDQLGNTRADGVEVGFTLRPADFLTLSQAFTYMDHEVDSQDVGAWVDSGRPKYYGTTSLTLLPVEDFSVTARVRYRDESSFAGVTDDFVVVDLLASYQLPGNMELYARVVNLLDEQYQVSFGKNTLGRSFFTGMRASF